MSKTARDELTGACCANCGKVFTLRKEDKAPYPEPNYCWRGCRAQHTFDLAKAEREVLLEKLAPVEY